MFATARRMTNAAVELRPPRSWDRILGLLPGYRFYAMYARASMGEPLIASAERRLLDRLAQAFTFEYLSSDRPAVIEEYVGYRRRPLMTARDVLDRLAMGRVALVVRMDGRIVGDVWSADADYPLPGRNRRLEEVCGAAGYVYSYLAYVAPEARARGAFPLLLERQFQMAVASGKRGLFGAVLPTSDASRRSLVRVGFRPFGALAVVRVANRSFTRFQLIHPLD